MKRISLQWRITLMTVLLIGVTCVAMNLLLCSSGVYYMDTIVDSLQGGGTVILNEEGTASFDPQLIAPNEELTIVVDGAQGRFRTTNWYITAAVTLLSGILAYFVSGRALKPLRSFASQVEMVQMTNLADMKIDEDVLPEFKQLSRSFNQMLERLNTAFAAQRQFTGNAAHELRTPLALMQAQLELFSAEHPDVRPETAEFLTLLRDKWEIDSILKRKIGENEIFHFELKDERIGTYKKNRYDHRHHALDASVIALIDRSMVQQISRLNQIGKKNRIEVPQMPVIRTDLIEKTKNIVVSFKPDHGAQGKLSKETLLGKIKMAEQVVISKIREEDIAFIKNEKVRSEFEKKLAELKDIKKVQKELKELYPVVWVFKEYYVCKENILGLKEKDFDSIIDKKIQKELREFTEAHKSEKIEDVMQKFSEQTKIKKVRCINRVQTPIEIKNKDGTMRYLCPEDYFAAVVWQIPPKNKDSKPAYKATFIRRDQVDLDGNPKIMTKPHPAAKKICILHKNDYLEFVDKGNWYKCRITGYAATSNKFDIRPIYAVSSCADWIIATNEAVLEPCWKPVPTQNWISVNVLFGEKSAQPITVNPIGRVFRKK